MSTKKLSTSRRTLLKGTAASAAIAPFFIGRSAKADDTITLTCSTAAPRDTPWGLLANGLKSHISKQTDGKVKLKVYFGGSRGDEASVGEQTKGGQMAIYAGSGSGLSKIVPELGLLELPFLVRDEKQGREVLKANKTLIHDILWEKGFKLLLFSENGMQDIGSTRPIEKPSDMKGLKIRTLESQVHIDFVESTGASALPMGVTEVLPSLQTGVIDGFTNTAIFSTAAAWTTGIMHWTVSAHCYQPAVVAVSRVVWEGLPAEIQASMSEDSEELDKLVSRTNRRLDAMKPQLLQNLSDLGITVHKPDREPWRKLAGPVHDKAKKGATKQGLALLKGIEKAL